MDTAVNYRHQRSERVIGAVLAERITRSELRRDEVVVATKGGYIPLDANVDTDPRTYFTDTYLRTGVVRPDDVVGGAHCMTPRYLADQIERSRQNLGLATIDIYYVHNPESQLDELERPVFLERLRDAFTALEQAVQEGKIGCYGTATWNGYRQAPTDPDFLALTTDRKSTRLNSSHVRISYAVFCLKKKNTRYLLPTPGTLARRALPRFSRVQRTLDPQ